MSVPTNFPENIAGRFCKGLLSVVLVLLLLTSAALAQANNPATLRIGTGGTSGTYFPVGSLIAEGLNAAGNSNPLTDNQGREVVVVAQRSNGSVSNVEDMSVGLLESALVQADIAHWAFSGEGSYKHDLPRVNLGAIASLYRESVHLVASRKSGIRSIADLVGKRVSVDEVGSGTELDVQLIFDTLKIAKDKINIFYLKPDDAISRLQQDQLDAFFIVAGYPVMAVSELINTGIAEIVPITGDGIDKLVSNHTFFTPGEIPAGTYSNEKNVETLAVSALWVANASLEEDVVFQLTRQFWSESVQSLLKNGHPKGREIYAADALLGLGIPLHPGAEKFYRESGIAEVDSSSANLQGSTADPVGSGKATQ